MKKFFSRGTELGLLILSAIVFAITLVSLELSQDNALTMDLVYLSLAGSLASLPSPTW